jgi:pyruvate dehydrogenase (quinone)
MAYKAANIVTESLSSIGVRRVYGIPGDTLNGFMASRRHRVESHAS